MLLEDIHESVEELSDWAEILLSASTEHPLQGHTTFQGLKISIENKAGSVRSGMQTDGSKWSIKMPFDYGYVKGTKGVDGDEVDVFVGPNKRAKYAYIVHQNKFDGTGYDEDKVMLGFDTATDAKKAYRSAYNNVDLFHSMTIMPMHEFIQKVKATKTKKRPGKIHAGGPGSGRHKEETSEDIRKKLLAKHKPFDKDGAINTSVHKDPEFHHNGIWHVQIGNHHHQIYKDQESSNWMQETRSNLHWSKDPDAIVGFGTKQEAVNNLIMKHIQKGDLSAGAAPAESEEISKVVKQNDATEVYGGGVGSGRKQGNLFGPDDEMKEWPKVTETHNELTVDQIKKKKWKNQTDDERRKVAFHDERQQKLSAGGPGSGRHKEIFNPAKEEMKRLAHEKRLADMRKKANAARKAAREEGTNARGKPIVSDKAKLAMKSANVATKEHHDLAESVEHTINKAIPGSVKSDNNKPFDIIFSSGKQKHGIEVKTVIYQKNDKITQKSDAISRKMKFAKKNGITNMHTVVVDHRGNTPVVLHREGVGSFRLGSMTPVKGGLKGLAAHIKGSR